MKNELTAKRLSIALSNANMKSQELADKSGVSKASISQYINGSHAPSNISSGKMSKILGVNPLWLMGFDVPMVESIKEYISQKSVTINVLEHIVSRMPLETNTNIIGTEEISEELAKTGNFFGLQIHGDSMEPKFSEGDVVIVRQQDDAKDGDFIVALVNGDDAICKKLKKYSDGIMLLSNNPKYEPMVFSNQDIIEKPVKIIGRVMELRVKF